MGTAKAIRFSTAWHGLWLREHATGRNELADVAYKHDAGACRTTTAVLASGANPPAVKAGCSDCRDRTGAHESRVLTGFRLPSPNDTVCVLVRRTGPERPTNQKTINRPVNGLSRPPSPAPAWAHVGDAMSKVTLPIPGIVHIPSHTGSERARIWSRTDLACGPRSTEAKIQNLGAETRSPLLIASPIQARVGVIPPITYWPEIKRYSAKYDILTGDGRSDLRLRRT